MGYNIIPEDTTRRLQQISMTMLLFFDEFCEKHGLLYFLCGGCCIGTIRHGGFIPWDDDVDIFMPRSDYEKLKHLWKDTEKYEIEYASESCRCYSTLTRINDKDTTFISTYTKDLDTSHGVAMDIFPLDGCPTGIERKKQKIWALLYSLYVVENAPTNHGKIVELIGKIGLGLVPTWALKCKVWKFCEKQMSKYSIADCNYITELCAGPGYMKNEYPKEAFLKPVRKSFEGHMLPIPNGYDTYLKMAFGDYLKLPPIEKRVAHHEYELIDLDNGYRKYRGVKYFTKKQR